MSIWQDHRALPPVDYARNTVDRQRDGIPAADSVDSLKSGYLRRDMDMDLSPNDEAWPNDYWPNEDAHTLKLRKGHHEF